MRHLPVIIALSLALTGCHRPQTEAAPPPPTLAPSPEPRTADDGPMQPADAVSPDDLAVLDAALSHFAADPTFQPGPLLQGHRLIVHSSTMGGSAFLRPDQVRADSRNGHLSEEALTDLERRNNGPLVQISGTTFSSVRRAGAALDAWSPTGPTVTCDDLGRFPKPSSRSVAFEEALKEAHPDAKAYVWVALPGYTADRRQAVVRLEFGPSAHGAIATFLLTREAAGSWTVTWGEFGYLI